MVPIGQESQPITDRNSDGKIAERRKNVTALPLAKDWAFIRAAVESLQDYLLSNELYWPLFVQPKEKVTGNLLQLTLGNLLLTQARLNGFPWTGDQIAELQRINEAIAQTREKWKSAWRKKAVREFPARFTLWQDYLDDLCEQPRVHAANYPFQVRWRTVLHFLEIDAAGLLGEETGRVKEADLRLKDVSQPANFVWEAEIASGFPKEKFWYLYLTAQGC